MFLQRTLLRLFKLALYALFAWLSVLVLYLSLPSPVPDDASVIASLQSGRTVTRVFAKQFFPAADSRQSVIIEFKLIHEESSGASTLLFGGGYDPLDKVNALLESDPTPNIPIHYSNVSLDDFGSDAVQISPVVTLPIPSGDMDGLVPPYVATADAALLYWWTSHDATLISFRVRKVPEEKLVEVWPDSGYWYGDHDKTGTPSGSQFPLLSVKFDKPENPPSFSFPPYPSSSSPSITYRLRLNALLFLLPLGAIGMLLFSAFSGILHGILELVYLILNIAALGVVCVAVYGIYWWIKNERPRMSVSLTDVREVLDNTLDNVRMRSEAREREGIDLEAQNCERDGVESVGAQDQAASKSPENPAGEVGNVATGAVG
ncbi:hypothetical protein AAF712_001687 [Marasmius tenuissimus]|uniref:Uncharacterized protein n=1 Tax=Marasmius tenuissimus TaxID=585030 RepID=A0ABR3ACK2_9AGAR